MNAEITNHDLVKKFTDFIREITTEDRVAILHDMDPDGSCSAILIKKALYTLGVQPKYIHHLVEGKEKTYFTQTIRKELTSRNINKIVCLDKPVDMSYPKDIEYLQTFEKVCIIDHHKMDKDINSEKIILIKPQLFAKNIEPTKYNTSKIVYDLTNNIVDVSNYDWICAVGVIADFNYDQWTSFVNNIFLKYCINKPLDIFESELGTVSALINFGKALGDKAFEKVVPVLDLSKNFKEAIVTFGDFKKVGDEVKKYIRDIDKYSEKHNDKGVTFMLIPSKNNIIPMLTTKLSINNPRTIIAARKDDEGLISISAKRNDFKYDMAKMLQIICAELGGQGGGHIPAAGGQIPIINWEEFKIIVLKRIEEFKV